jgi:integrase
MTHDTKRQQYGRDHIEQRGRQWYARLNIPKDIQAKRIFKSADGTVRKKFRQALGTTDPVRARLLAAPIVAEWQARIIDARDGQNVPLAPQIGRSPESWTAAYRRATPEQRKVMLEFIEDDAADEVGLPFAHVADDPNGEATDKDRRKMDEYIAIATGERVATTENLEEYLATLHGRLERKSIDMKDSSIRRFAEAFKHLAEVTRPAVQRWLNKLAADGAASATVSRQLSEVRGYWKYLISVAAVPEDVRPFDNLTVPTSKRVKADQRQPFTTAEVSRLLAEARRQDDTDVANVIELGRWTGARIEELGALRVDHVDLRERSITIGAAKSDAGVRVIPIHSKLLPLMRRLIKASKDGYVLSGQKPNKYGDRAGAVGHRFGRLKTAMKFGPHHVFHSIRKTVATQFENAHVLENIAAAILGHEFNTMSYGVYSGGPSLAVKRKAVERLRYPR